MGALTSKTAAGPSSVATPWEPSASSIVDEAETKNWKTYDYIILGSGPAGCVLASRLSEDPSVNVLLVEAGKSNEGNLLLRIPIAWNKLFKTSVDWNYNTVPQDSMGGRPVYWPRGKVLGGTSSINAMIYDQCPPDDFDSWERKGAQGWGYTDLKAYFDKALKDGPRKSKLPEMAPVCAALLQATETLGIQTRADFNTEGAIGAGPFSAAVYHSERNSAATAYLNADVRKRPNLTIAVSTFTERILFTKESDTPRAVGVQLSSGRLSRKFVARARAEVVLCAGAVASPQLLQLSGIGDASDLARIGVPVVRDLPSVGRNLLDHLSAGPLVLRAKPGWTWDHLTQNPLYAGAALLQWLISGHGPMASLSAQVGVFTKLNDPSVPYGPSPPPVKDLTSGPGAPDLELMVFPVAILDRGLNVPSRGNLGLTIGATVLKPASSGTVTLRTASVYDPPLIDPRYFQDESDMNALVRGVRLIMHIARTAPLSSALDLHARSAPNPNESLAADFYWPGDADPDAVSDEQLRTWLRMNSTSAMHPTSSVRMGSDAATSAVDLRLHVHGVRGLRVVDASVFPDQVSGHPCVPVLAVAERAADLIKADAAVS